MEMCIDLLTHIPLTSLVTKEMHRHFEPHDMWDCMGTHMSYMTPSLGVMYGPFGPHAISGTGHIVEHFLSRAVAEPTMWAFMGIVSV